MLALNNYGITTRSNRIFKVSVAQSKLAKELINRKYIKYAIKTTNPFLPKKINLYHFTLRKKNIFTITQFDFHFLKKEKLYTKLKYSRSPQYDIVSGGVAAIFSAFIGFLVSEKFGIELVDSGDFYILFMYSVFGVFSIRPLVKVVTKFNKITPVFSILPLLDIINTCFVFVFNKFTNLLNKIKTY